MMINDQGGIDWHKSTYSPQNGDCVEQGLAKEDGTTMVRDTKMRGTGPVIGFDPAAWTEFITFVK
jgi:hypothetical protein